MDFEELLKYCTELNESPNEKCLICHIPLDNDEKYIKLSCSHIFHPLCINYKFPIIKCLYCEKTSKPSIMKYASDTTMPSIQVNQICCKFILKTGPNKGKYCNRNNCKYHKLESKIIQVIDSKTNKIVKPKKKIVKNKIKNGGCQTLIKTGPKAGQLCERTNCKYHKELKPKIVINKKIVNKKPEINKQPLTFQQILDKSLTNINKDDDLIEV